MSTEERQNAVMMKKALLKNGIPINGLTPEQIQVSYNALTGDTPKNDEKLIENINIKDAIQKTQKALKNVKPEPEPEPQPAPAPQPEPEPVPAQLNDDYSQLAQLLARLGGNGALDEKRVIELIKQHSTVNHVHTIQAFDKKAVTIEGAHQAFDTVLEWLQVATVTNTAWPYLVGPAGSGKTTLGKQLAESLSVEFYATESLTDKFELIGFSDANDRFHETPFYTAFKQGGVFLLDEIDRSAPEVVVAFNMALANGFFTFPNGERVERHNECYFVAGGNTDGTGPTAQYNTAQLLDASTRDRFSFITVGYDLNLETKLATQTASTFNNDFNTDNLLAWIDYVLKARRYACDNELDLVISPRTTISGAALIGRGHDLESVITRVIAPSFTTEQQLALERAA